MAELDRVGLVLYIILLALHIIALIADAVLLYFGIPTITEVVRSSALMAWIVLTCEFLFPMFLIMHFYM